MRPRTRPAAAPGPLGADRFRPDIEGLRAVAVVAVLLYHAGVPWASGGYVGVDVFFVISGYLITGLLLRELETTGRVSLTSFYGRRAKRLLPALSVVLVAVAVLSWAVLPPVRRMDALTDVIASAAYVVNWWLAHNAVDYSAVGMQPSPVQNIWSLAVEEQFYLAWPLLLLAATAWSRRRRRGVRGPVTAVLAVTTVASFLYCVHLTATAAGVAYFSTFARAWELGLGGILAVGQARLRPSRNRATPFLWTFGAGAICFSVAGFDNETLFPGAAALLPTLGTAALILAGSHGTDRWPVRLLATRGLRHVGRLSYTWYLWHWPLLVFAVAAWELSVWQRLLVVALSYIPTLLTHLLVEERFRHSISLTNVPMRAVRLGLVCSLGVALVGVLLKTATPTVPTASAEQAPGAKALHASSALQRSADAVRPAPEQASRDRGRMYDDGCLTGKLETAPQPCVYGDPTSGTTVVLFGDSHAMHWFPGLVKVAERRHWRLVGLTKSGCPPSMTTVFDNTLRRAYHECDSWRSDALAEIERISPALVVTSSMTDYTVVRGEDKLRAEDATRALRDGYAVVLQELAKSDARVVTIHDVPRHGAAPDCVASHLDALEACAVNLADAFAATPLADAARDTPGIQLIDAAPQLCPRNVCAAVIGNVLVYRNAGHLTATFAATLDDWLDDQLPAVGAAPGSG